MLRVCITPTGGYLDNQWDYVLTNFKPDLVYALGSEGMMRDVVRITSLSEVEGSIVVLTPKHGRYVKGVKSLLEFEHPEDVTYVFGSDKEHLTIDAEPDELVYIPTDTGDEMYAHVAAAITLWHRRYG